MAEKRTGTKSAKPSRLSASANYTIGGKKYNPSDISRLKPQTKEVTVLSGMENAPRQVGKRFENQSGVVYTGTEVSRPNVTRNTPSESVHSQSEIYKPSENTQATVQRETTPQGKSYKPSESISINTSATAPIKTNVRENNIHTERELYRAAESRVYSQTEEYYSNNAYNTEKSNIASEVGRTPRTVDAVKTSTVPIEQRDGYRPNAQPNRVEHTASTSPIKTQMEQPSYAPSNPTPSVPQVGKSGEVKTGSSISRETERRVQAQTDIFHSNNAYNTEKSNIASEVGRTPRTVDAVKTSTVPTEQGSGYRPNAQPNMAVQTGSVNPVKTQVEQPIYAPSNPTPSVPQVGKSSEVKTGSSISHETERRVQAQTESFHSNNAYNTEKSTITSEVGRTPRTVDAVKTSTVPTEQGSGYKPNAQPNMAVQTGSMNPVKTQMEQPSYTPSNPTSSVPQVGKSGEVKTGSSISHETERRVQAQTDIFHSNNAYNTEKSTITSEVGRTPRTVDAVKTSTVPTEQGSGYKPNAQPNMAVQTGSMNPVKTQMEQPSYTPSNLTSSVPQVGKTGEVKTGSSISRETERRVQAQTDIFHSNNAYNTEKSTIASEVGRTPRTVDAVKTAQKPIGQTDVSDHSMAVNLRVLEKSGAIKLNDNGTYEIIDSKLYQAQMSEIAVRHGVSSVPIEQKNGYRPNAQPNGAVHTGTVGNKPSSPFNAERKEGIGFVGHGHENVRTGSQIANMAEKNVQVQTDRFHSNNAFQAGITGIQNNGQNIPKNVEGIKTATNLQHGIGVPKEQKDYKVNLPTVGVGKGISVALSPQQIEELQANVMRIGATGNLITGNMQYGSNVARAFTLTGTAKDNAIAGKLLGGKFATGTGSTREFIRGLGVVAKYSVSTEAAKALQQWKNTPKKNELLSGGKMILGKAEGNLLTNDDLGTQGAGGVVAAGMMGATAFKTTGHISEIGIEGIKKVGSGVYQVTTTAGLSLLTVGRTAKTLVEKQSVLMSKDAISILKQQAKISGLNNTKLAKGIINKVETVKNTYNNALTSVRQIKSTVKSGARTVKTAVDTSVKIVHGVATGTLTLNMAKASLKAFRNRAFNGIKTGVKKGVQTAVGYAVRGTAVGATNLALRGIPKAGKILKGTGMTMAGAMTSADDYAVQGVGNAIIATEVGIKTAVRGTKATGYAVKTSVKGGKALYTGAKFIKNHGLKMAWQRARAKFTKKMFDMGQSVVSSLIMLVKLMGRKVVIPLLLICIIGSAVMGGISAPVMAVGTIFGGVFDTSDTNTEYNIREYLLDSSKIPSLSSSFKQNLANQMQNSKSSYHIVRFYSNTGSGDVIEPTLAGVTSVFPTDEELANMLQPIFNAMILMEYDLEPTEAEANAMLTELFNGLFRVTTATSQEQCGQAILDGEGTVTVHSCGSVHALDDCPNYENVTHTSYTCSDCDKYTCNGHKGSLNCGKTAHTHTSSCESRTCGKTAHSHSDSCETLTCTKTVHLHTSACYDYSSFMPYLTCTKTVHSHNDACYSRTCGKSSHTHTDSCYSITCGKTAHTHQEWVSPSNTGCYNTTMCSGTLTSDCGNSTFSCTGNKYCKGHTVISYTLNLDGVYALEAKYFTDPINQLSNINPRTDEQEQQLQNLKDYYEIFQEIMGQVAQEYGGGLTMSDLSGVAFVNGTRVANQSVVDLALSQVGQQGGQPYWSYYGFGSRVEWCACFVHWCMRKTPSATNCYPTTANNAYCQTVANNFMSMGQWGDKNYTNLVAGDTIFFDWQPDGHTDHIGIVIGQDGTYVYTVEGNSGDAVRVCKYRIGSSVIYGYGLMNY